MPTEIFTKLRDLGLMAMLIPERYGGTDVGYFAYILAIEELSRWSPSIAIAVSVQNSIGGVGPILDAGTDEQKDRFLPRLATSSIGSFCLTEPGAGSDAAALRATARREGNDYILDGTKTYVTNGDVADIFVVMAKTDPGAGHRGISAFVAERDSPGFKIGTKEKKMGLKASGTVEVILDGCRVPAKNLLGQEGQGFKIALASLDGGRIGVGAQAVGLARAALDESRAYAKARVAFGKPIAEFQAIQWKLADMATDVEAARLLVLQAAQMKERGLRVTKEAAMAKLFASEMVQRVCGEAVQIHGGYGFIRDYAVERHFRDSRVMALYEGTSEIQRLVIAREVLRD
jgi:alkylation response protein AidB-like acyl-CoA dehydrogenase